jgi:hypothetical protein
VELSAHLLTAQYEIETLLAQLRNADATIQGYRRMVEGQASDATVRHRHLDSHLLGPEFGQGARSEQSLGVT